MFVMAHVAYLREKARSLRLERRLAMDELAERLALPRTTLPRDDDLPLGARSADPGFGVGRGGSKRSELM